jgi:signal transduction histidine kinase/CheY-like chemotaxis protein
MLSRLKQKFKASLQSYGFKFFLSVIILIFIVNAFLFFSVIGGLANLHELYTKAIIKHTKAQVENALSQAYDAYLKKRDVLQALDSALSQELLESLRSQAEREVERIVIDHSVPQLGVELLLAKEPKGLKEFEVIEFRPFNFRMYLGASSKAYFRFLLALSGTLFLFFILILVLALLLLRYFYFNFKKPLDSLVLHLEKGGELSLTGYRELDALVLAIKTYTEREKELLSREHKLQLELEKSARLSAIGTMAGGYAHEFNNLLQMILFNLELAEKAIKEGDCSLAHKHFENIRSITSRGQNLARRILYLTKSLPGETSHVCDVIQNLMGVLRTMVPREIELRYEFKCPNPCTVPLTLDSLKEVLLNLIKNAVEAIEEVKDKVERKEIKVSVVSLEKKELLLAISDTGCGMTEEVKAKIFTPFFTTKGFEKGTGLGLFVVYNLVKNAGGRIEVESEPMQGTTFKVYLPVVEEERIAEKTEEKEIALAEAKPKPIRKILVVDDEEDIREALKDYLAELGYEVTVAENGKTAYEALLAKDYDLVLMDMFMPEMNGAEVLLRLKEAGKIPSYVVLMTGYAGEDIATIEALKQEGIIKRILRKPFSFKDLEDIIKG